MTALLRIKSRKLNAFGQPRFDVQLLRGGRSIKRTGFFTAKLYRSRLTLIWFRPFILNAYTPLRKANDAALESFDRAVGEVRA